eukprot:551149-Hanusia_phi.AAC.1
MGGPMQGAGELDGLAVARAVGPAEDERHHSSIRTPGDSAARQRSRAAKPRRAWNFGSELG